MNKIFKNKYDNALRFHTGLALPMEKMEALGAEQALQLQHKGKEYQYEIKENHR